MTNRILVIGSLNMDMVVVTPRHPLIGETILGNSFNTYPGGKGANQAVAAARLGTVVQMVGCLGDDGFGKALRENLIKNKVDPSLIKKAVNTNTGTALITVDATGKNSIIVVPGANHEILPVDIDHLEGRIAGSALIILQMEIPLETVWRSIQIARKFNVPVLLNPAPAHPIPDEYLNGLDYLVPNENELCQLTGLPTNTIEEIKIAVRTLIERGVRRVILTRGEHGCFYSDREKELVLPAYPVRAVDTTAAGDAFIGGFSSSLVQGMEIIPALKTGLATGAMAVTRAGAQTSLPNLEELESFLKIYRS